MMMLEKNNLKIAAAMADWLEHNVEKKGQHEHDHD
jgi:hypothetical protein